MALVLKDRVKETSATAGTGALTLGGTSTGYQAFAVIGNGNTTYYTIYDNTTGAWEVGTGTYTSSTNTLSRDSVFSSSNGGNLVDFASNTKDVFVAYPAEEAVTLDSAQTLSNKTLSNANLGTPTAGVLTNATGLPLTTGVTGTLPVNKGGTGNTTYTNGQLLIGNAAGGLTKATLTAGTGVTITNGDGTITINAPDVGTVTSVTASAPLASSGGNTPNISLTGTVAVANGGTGATTASGARTNLGAAASGANADITSMTGITGGISTPDYIDFDTAATVTPQLGRIYWDGGTTLNVGMTANVNAPVNESLFIYVKASAAITKGQVIVQDGSVGASGVLKAKPSPTLLTSAITVLGVAAEDIALNGFGLIQTHGYLRGFNTTGSSVSETWADGDLLYYNPNYAGSFTKVIPSAPYIKLPLGEVVNAASSGSGEIIINIGNSSTLGGTDSNVQFGTLNNTDLITYDSALGYWKNVAPSTVTVGNVSGVVAVANGGTGATTATGAQTNLNVPSTTGSGASGTWGISVTGTAANVTGTVAVANGGTGLTTTPTNGKLLIGNGTGYTLANITAGTGVSVTNGAGSITIAATGAGDVAGPSSATNNAITLFDGTTGKLIKQQADITSDTFSSGVGGPWGRFNVGGTTTYGKVNIVGTLPTSISSTSAAVAQVCQLDPTGPSYSVSDAYGFYNELNITTARTVGSYRHFQAKENITGTSAGVQYQAGFWADDTITSGSIGNYGFYSALTSGSTKWNIYAFGTAQNYIRGNVGIGAGMTAPAVALDVKGTFRLNGSTSGYVGLAPAAAAGSTTYTLPTADGTNGQVLSTNGSGTLSWTTAGGGGSAAGAQAYAWFIS